jgi:hypothetical protein
MSGFVYLIRNGDLHKIGRSDNPSKRFRQLKPDEVIQVLETDRSRDLEYELHQRFKDKRLPQSEYFRLSDAEVNAARIALGWNPEASVTLHAAHEVDSGARKSRSEARITGLTALATLAMLLVESSFLGVDPNLLESLFEIATLIVFLISLLGFTVSSGNYWIRLAWFKLGNRSRQSS